MWFNPWRMQVVDCGVLHARCRGSEVGPVARRRRCPPPAAGTRRCLSSARQTTRRGCTHPGTRGTSVRCIVSFVLPYPVDPPAGVKANSAHSRSLGRRLPSIAERGQPFRLLNRRDGARFWIELPAFTMVGRRAGGAPGGPAGLSRAASRSHPARPRSPGWSRRSPSPRRHA